MPDPHQEIDDLEAEVDELAHAAERCRKVIVLAKVVTGAGAVLFALTTVVPDPVAAGFVASLARPGGNATGFASFEYGIGGKWLELLREIASGVTRVGVVRDPAITAGAGQWSAIQA
jgi:ABC-type uncharacterized transport system substrate-binding protein